jgi:NAD(P)-dependent dehydrogenase (short-subunit alcohol dehydrogenase family)
MATAQVLAKRGHWVAATDLFAPGGSEGIQAHVLDVTSDDSVARCLEELGPLDVIVNNAAIFGGGPVEGYPLDRFRQMFETNTLGALRVIRAVLPAWRKRGWGVIVNVSSVSGRVSSPLDAACCASKFALGIGSTRTRCRRISHRQCNRRPRDAAACFGRPGR